MGSENVTEAGFGTQEDGPFLLHNNAHLILP
jgi:hypothetical protein